MHSEMTAGDEVKYTLAYIDVWAELVVYIRYGNEEPRLGLLRKLEGTYNWKPDGVVAVGLKQAFDADRGEEGYQFSNEGRDDPMR
jgi:hypothetical protein